MCLNPRWVYRKGTRKLTTYNGAEGEGFEIGIFAKCGCCEQCNSERANSWVVRNSYESRAHREISFITLTYAESPQILVRKDLQDFMKRLRKKLPNKVRMFGCGEYGKKGRPHYHLIIYGWSDKEKKYIGINRKKNILYQSEIIQKAWGKGRTTIDDLQGRAIPYLTLYESPKEKFSKCYKMTLEKARFLRSKEFSRTLSEGTRKNLYKEINEIEKTLKKTKEEYYAVKEFNCWSLSLGWNEFIKEYCKSNDYCWEEYIEDKTFPTPTSWVKKIANEYGDMSAVAEIKRREKICIESMSEDDEKMKNYLSLQQRKKKEILEWHDKKNEVEGILE